MDDDQLSVRAAETTEFPGFVDVGKAGGVPAFQEGLVEPVYNTKTQTHQNSCSLHEWSSAR